MASLFFLKLLRKSKSPDDSGVSLGKDAFRRLLKNRIATVSAVIVVMMAILVIVWPFFVNQVIGLDDEGEMNYVPAFDFRLRLTKYVPIDPNHISCRGLEIFNRDSPCPVEPISSLHKNVPPWSHLVIDRFKIETKNIEEAHWFSLLGTDNQGRDILERCIYGGRLSLEVGFFATIVAVIIGVLVGVFSGYFGGFIDNLIMRGVDVLMGIPFILLAIVFMAIVGDRSIANLFFALALISWLTIARLVRGQVLSLREKEFVMAARIAGSRTIPIVVRHLIPNVMGLVIIYSTLLMPAMILTESFLSFIGLGVPDSEVSWGSLVSDGSLLLNPVESYWWQLFFPSVFLGVFLLCLNFVGDGLRDALDPRQKK